MSAPLHPVHLLASGARRTFASMLGLLGLCLLFASASVRAAAVEYTYDANGRLVGVYAPSGDAAQYVYDAAGNITQIKRFAGATLAITEFSPTSGPVGTQVSVYGTGFSATASSDSVTFNGVAATVSAATANKLSVTVPSGATTGPIAVTVASGTASSSVNFVVTAGGSTAPTITTFAPASGVPGSVVTITGTNFDPTPTLDDVNFNATFATAASATSTSLSVAVPGFAASGKIKVQTRAGTAYSVTDFLVPFGTFAATDIAGSSRAIVDGATATFTSPSSTKVSMVLFDGTQGQNLGIGITGVTPTNACVNVSIRRPDNVELLASSSVCAGGSVDIPLLPLTGTYTVAVVASSGTSVSGTVTISADNAGALAGEGTVATYTTTRAGQNGRYQVAGAAGQKAAFYVFGLSTAVQPSRVDLLLPNGQLLASAASSGASAYIQTQTLPTSGTYTIFITPSGAGSGSWSIQYGQPDLTVTSFTVGTVSVAHNGAYSIPTTAVVKNQGTVGAKGVRWFDELYLSSDSTLDTSDTVLTFSSPTPDVPAGTTYTASLTGTSATSVAAGVYTVFFKTDGWDSGSSYSAASDILRESDETNNVASASVTLLGRPDLVASSLSVGAISVNRDGSYNIPATFTVTNSGASTAIGGWYDFAFLSNDSVLDTADPYLGWTSHSTDLASGASYVASVSGSASSSVTPGSYTLIAKADSNNAGAFWAANDSSVAESDETNNTQMTAITLPTRPDLVISAGPTIGTIAVNTDHSYSIDVTFTVQNNGGSTAKAGWYDECYLSTDGVLDSSDLTNGFLYHSIDLAAGTQYTVSMTCRTSTTTTAGTYTYFVKTDGYDSGGKYNTTSLLFESNEANNVSSTTITLP